MQGKSRDIELNLFDIFRELISHWMMILVVAVAFGIVGFSYGKLMVTPMYSSKSVLYVLSKSTSITSMADIQVGSSLTNDYMLVVGSRPVLDEVIESLELTENYQELKNKVTVSNTPGTRMLEITVIDGNVERAKKIADKTAEVSSKYIAQKMDQDPPTILQKGYTDGKPVTKGASYYALSFAAVGALILLLIYAVMYIANDKIMTADDLEKWTGVSVLATVPVKEGHREKRNS